MGAPETLYIYAHRRPRWIERGRTQTVEAQFFEADGQTPLIPTACTYTLRESGGATVIDAATATPGAVCSYTINASAIPASLGRSDSWQEIWLCTVNGYMLRFDRRAALVARLLYPTLTDAQVGGTSALYQQLLQKRGSFQAFREEAWDRILTTLMSKERWPDLILEPSVLWLPHLELTRALIARDCQTDLPGGGFEEQFNVAMTMFKDAWAELQFVYDTNQDGAIQEEEAAAGPQPVVFVGTFADPRRGGGAW